MKKLLFFPYHPDMHTVYDYKADLIDAEITGFISFKEDSRVVASLNEKLGIVAPTEEELLANCDVVILLDNYRNFDTTKYFNVIDEALRLEKELLILPLAASQLNLDDYAGKYSLLERKPDGNEGLDAEYHRRKEYRLNRLSTPTIGVAGLGKHCSKFETQMLLSKVLETNYTVVSLTSNALGALFGCYTLPSFLFSDCSFSEKVVRFNCYFRLLDILGADVITVGIPEGIMPFEKREFHHFAEYPLVMSSAIDIDIAILCAYYAQGESFEELQSNLSALATYCEERFEFTAEAFALSRTTFDIPQDEHGQITYDFFDERFIQEHYPSINDATLPIVNLLDHVQAAAVISERLSCLTESVQAV